MIDKKTLTGLCISLLLFVVALFFLANTYGRFEHVNITEARVEIEEISVVKNKGIRLQWNCDNTQVTSYQIFRKEVQEEEYSLLKVLPARKKYYLDTEVSTSNEYDYRVRAFNNFSEESPKSSQFSEAVSVYFN